MLAELITQRPQRRPRPRRLLGAALVVTLIAASLSANQATAAGAPVNVISGTVFEDIAGDVLDDGVISDAANPGVAGVDVDLWRDELGPTALDTAGNAGLYTSIKIGSDGYPVISYVRDSQVTLLHCDDASCSTSTTQVVDNTVNAAYTAMAIGADGLPIISYYDSTNADLRVAHCNDLACTTATVTTVDAAGSTGAYSSITISDAGLPIIAFADLTDRQIRVAFCSNVACTSSTQRLIETVGGTSNAGTSIAIGTDGNPILSYFDSGFSSREIRVAHCTDAACTTTTISVIDSTVENGSGWTHLAIGSDGLPIVSYYHNLSIGGGRLRVAKCGDIACTTSSYTTIEEGNAGSHNAIAIGPDGLPIIAFNGWINTDLRVARCTDLSCTAFIVGSIDAPGQNGEYVSITHGLDGRPLISYRKTTGQELKLAGPDGDGIPSGGDALVGSTTTGAGGAYSFAGLEEYTYFVAVDSTTVGPTAGLDTGATQSDVWAEQTWGPTGAHCADGAGGTSVRGVAGPCYGGQAGGVSDVPGAITTAEHLATVTVTGDVTNVDFGFSFNAVTTTAGGDTTDDDPAANRTVQGSLRQLIDNANAIVGANTMRFVPAEATNATDGTNDWWRISVTNGLPPVDAPSTTVDGTAHDLADGITVVDPNPTLLGTGGTVGVDDLALPQVPGPELELLGDLAVDTGLSVSDEGDNSVVRRLAISGFQFDGLVASGSLTDKLTGVLVEQNVLGSGPSAFVDPGAGNRQYRSMYSYHTTLNGTVRHNLIGFAETTAFPMSFAATDLLIEGNEIRSAVYEGLSISLSGSQVSGDITVRGNLVTGNGDAGVSMYRSYGGNTVENNTITGNGSDFSAPGVNVWGTGNAVSKNVVTANAAAGVVIAGERPVTSPTWTASTGNLVSQNVFGSNGGVAVDLVESSDTSADHWNGDGITLTPGTLATTGNNGLDAPVISEVTAASVTGTSCASCDVEVYRAAAGAGDTAATVDYGEGVEYLGTTTASGAGEWTLLTTLSEGDVVSAITIDASNDTSEFATNVALAGPPVANDDADSTERDTPVTIDVLANDTDPDTFPLTVDSVTQGTNGTVVDNGSDVTYTPHPWFTGVDTFTYDVTDGASTDTATVTVTVTAPAAVTLGGTVFEDLAGDGLADGTVGDANNPGSPGVDVGLVREGPTPRTLESTGDVGTHTSIAIGADGVPIIAYRDVTNTNLMVAHCDDALCTTATSTTVDSAGDVGEHTAIAIGADGLPVISYHDLTNTALKVAHCDDVACTTATTTTVDDSADVGLHTSITIGADTLPIVSYYDATDGDLEVARCDDLACTTATLRTIDATGDRGRDSSIAIGSDGLPIISYYDTTNGNLRVAHCDDQACTTSTSLAADTTDDTGRGSSITIAPDGFPRISAFRITDVNRRFVQCFDLTCSTRTTTGSTGFNTWGDDHYATIIGPDGFAWIAAYDVGDQDLRFVSCNAENCGAHSNSRVDNVGDVGRYPSIALGADGTAVMAAYDATNGDLRIAIRDGVVGTGDRSIATTTTDVNGDFAFTGQRAGLYMVAAHSHDVEPSAGYTVAGTAGDVWAEQTFGPVGAFCADGTGGTASPRATAGACYGGRRAASSDSRFLTSPSGNEHLALVDGTAGSVTDLDYGFSFAVVTNTSGGDTSDHDTTQPRTVQGSLRQFVQNANATSGADSMRHVPAMPTNSTAGVDAWWRVSVSAVLPTVTDAATTIDGTAHDLADGTTPVDPNSRGPELELDGTGTSGLDDGLTISGGTSTVRDVAVNRFADAGIVLTTNGGNTVAGNYIGLDATGTADAGNGTDGIVVAGGSTGNTIGGPTVAERNHIAGNDNDGIWITGSGTDGNTVLGNWIGFGSDGSAIPNSFHGIGVENGASDNLIGGTIAAAANRIGNNAWDGVAIAGGTGTGNAVIGNSIATNTGLGIDFDNDGHTANDPGDTDGPGPNDWLNHPVVTAATEAAGTVTVDFDLDVPAGDYRVEVFTNPSGVDPTGYGEGEQWETATTITHTGSGVESFSVAYGGTAGDEVTLTATEESAVPVYGSTSELSAAFTVTDATTAVVNSTRDLGDASPGDDVCHTGFSNTQGDPECTLRAAIEEANGPGTIDRIVFAIPATEAGHSGGVWTISPGSPLQNLSQTVTIDATTQPGWASTPVVELNGAGAGGTADGFRVDGDNIEIRGLAIGRFLGDGIEVLTGATGTIIAGNHIGADATGTLSRGNDRGVNLGSGSASATVGGTDPGDGNLVSGNTQQGIVVWNSDANLVIANRIGTDVTGNAPLPNGDDGIGVSLSDFTVVGQAGYGNVLSGNAEDGIEISGVNASTTIQANTIGLGADGTTPLANGRHGVVLYNGTNLTQVGGGGAGEGNVISNNTVNGVHIDGNNDPTTAGNVVEGNLIGVDAGGTLDRGNGTYGVRIYNQATATTVGSPGAGNVISGNGTDGIYIEDPGTTGTVIQGNQIGTNANGDAAVPNGDRGVQIESGATNIQIGGTGAGAGNVISGNTSDGIIVADWLDLGTTGAVIEGNLVGVTADGTSPMGNGQHGIFLDPVTGNRVGGDSPAAGNIVANNAGRGIQTAPTAGTNTILGNETYDNGGLGIDLAWNDVTLNDAGDVDSGPNDLLNFPEVTAATETAGTVTVDFDLDVPAGDYRIEVFTNPSGIDPSGYGESEQWENATTITHTGSGAESFQITYTGTIGDQVTLTTTEQSAGPVYGATSELSLAYTVTGANAAPTADAGGPYTIAEGEPLSLDASASTDPDDPVLTYAWDLDNDSLFDDATGETPVVGWGALVTLGFDDDGGPHPVAVQVDDGTNPPVVDATTFAITNAAPTLTTTGAATVTAGAVYTLTLGVSDPGADTVTGWTIDWGDGTVETIGGNPPSVTHVYANEGHTNPILAAATDEDGTWHQNRLLVTSGLTDELLRYEATTGVFVDAVGGPGDGLSAPSAVAFGPDGAVYVASATTADVRRFDPVSGGLLSVFVAAGAGGLSEPSGLAFGPDGHLYVADATDGDVVRFDPGGVPAGTFVTAGAGGLSTPRGLTFGPGDDLYVASAGSDEVLRYDGATGAFVETFVATGSGGLSDPRALVFGPDGDLYVASAASAQVLRFDGATGAFDTVFATGGGLTAPAALTFGPGGDLYVTDSATDIVVRFDGTTGTPVGDHVLAGAGGLSAPSGLAFVPGHQVTVQAKSAPVPAGVLDTSQRRSDLAAAGGLTIAGTPAVAGDGQVLAGGTQRLVGPAVDVTSTALTVSGWVNRGASAIDQRLVAKTSTEGSTVYELLIDGGTDQAVARVHTDGATREARGGTVSVGAWHHLAAVWNGTVLTLYVDGAPVDTIAAPGTLTTDPDLPVTLGNITTADRGLTGTLDQITVNHRAFTDTEIATLQRTQRDPATTLAVGAQQTGTANPWTVTGTQTRSGSFSLEAPTAGPGQTAWATAIGIDEPGIEVDTWWWTSTDTGIDLATGVRTGNSPTDQWETALTSPAGWDLGRTQGTGRTQHAPPAGVPTTGTWTKVTVRSDENGDTSVWIDDTQIIAPTNQGATPTSGSIGLRAGTLAPTDNWYIDDIRARRLTSIEPTTTLGPLDRR